MCSLFGFLDYQEILPHRMLKKLTQALANAAEERGKDAAGISYVQDGKIVIHKSPKPAHKLHFNPPKFTRAVMGHTRMTTQGSEKNNENNHPFSGVAGDTAFAFAHNGVLWNDKELRRDRIVPKTTIETDSYIGVQLIEKQGQLDFDSLKYMAETVEGSFTFSLLDENNSLFFVKGSNPLCLLHFESIGLYVYASTEDILKNALKRVGLHVFASERIDVEEGDIIKIDRNGNITRSEFEPKIYRSKYGAWYGLDDSYYSSNLHEEMLLAYCGCYGVDSEDVEFLLEYGYTCDEVEDLMMDTSAFKEEVRAIKHMDCEYIHEEYCDCYY